MNLDNKLGPHYLNFGFSANFLSDVETEACIELPYPVNKPLPDPKIDKIDKFHEDTKNYHQKLGTLKRDFPLARNKVMNQSFTDSYGTVTKGILDFCNMDKPGVTFSCDYNPFYGTGFLEYVNLDGVEYLVRPDSGNDLRLMKLTKPWKNKKISLETPFDDDILGISSDSENFLLLRHKHQVNLLQINNNVGEIKRKKKFKRPLLDSKRTRSKLGVVLTDTKFRLYDIETNKKIDLKEFNTDGITRFEFTQQDIALLGRKKFQLIDQRSSDYRTFQPELQDCNFLCSFKVHNDLLYLASRHHLMRTDIRFLKEVEYCTHLMRYGPCYLDFLGSFLCLSSQNVGENVIFSGDPIGSLPRKIPSVLEGLNECRLKRDVLLKDGLDERLGRSIGGVKLISENNDLFLYTANSLGDIYKQKITKTLSSDETDPIECLHYWINKLPEVPKPLHLTHVENMSDARFALNKRIQTEHLTKFNHKPKKADRFINHYNNVYNKNNLGELAKNFLSIWDDEEEGKPQPEQVNLVPEVAPLDKVTSWIQSNYFFD